MLNKKRKRNTGQTLIEVIVVIGIVAAIYATVGNLSAYSIKIATLSKQKIEAGGIAQQAIERIRNIRDTNLKNDKAFDFDINTNPALGNKIVTHKDSNNPDQGFEAIPGPEETIGVFKRQISIKNVSGDEIEIDVTVKWDNNRKQIKISNYLTNWKQ